ncbi:hypothetical protein ATANTOWER_002031 [Ataeniobius toweri]|uniref:Uncharacterized protein n=1 Tax=Ataeniobius toweri TaxID=208326 RepID=A0ABU7B1D0_9TELE|nr:hypothetical protein [Ataeniobius toweri]
MGKSAREDSQKSWGVRESGQLHPPWWSGRAEQEVLGGWTGFAQLEAHRRVSPKVQSRNRFKLIHSKSLVNSVRFLGWPAAVPQRQNAQATKCRRSLFIYCPADERDELHLSSSSTSRKPHLVVKLVSCRKIKPRILTD